MHRYSLICRSVSFSIKSITSETFPFCRPFWQQAGVICHALKGRGDENYLIVAVEMLDQIPYMASAVSVSNGNTSQTHISAPS